MASALMARVWICLTLAQLNNAGGQRHARGLLSGQDEVDGGMKQQPDAAQEASMERGFPAPVWNFLQGGEKNPESSDFNQPQYRCNNGTLSLRFSLIRHSNLRLEDGAQLLSLTDVCNSTVQIFKWWMLVKLSYTACHMAMQTKHESGARVLKLRYNDHLRKEDVTGVAICKSPELLTQVVPPLVACGTKRVTVKLPREAKLQKVKDLDFSSDEGYSVKQQRTTNALFVEISKLPSKDSGFEVVYVDSNGTLCTMLAACSPMLPKKVRRHPVKRSLQEPDVFELWGFEEIPTEPFNPSQTVTSATASPTIETNPVTDSVTDSGTGVEAFTNDGNIFELWGFETVPVGVFTGLPGTGLTTTTATTAGPATTATTAKTTKATTTAKTTKATTARTTKATTAKTTKATTAKTTKATTAKTTKATTAKTTKATTAKTTKATTAKTTKATTKTTKATTAKTTKATTAKTTKATTAKTTKATTAKTTKATTAKTTKATTAKTTKATTTAKTTKATTAKTTKATTTAKTTKATTAKTTKATTTAKTTKATTAKTTKATTSKTTKATTSKTTKATTTAKTTKATTAPPPTTTVPPTTPLPTTSAPPQTTSAPPQTTSAPPVTTAAPLATTSALLATTSAAPVTTSAPLATTLSAGSSTTTAAIATT